MGFYGNITDLSRIHFQFDKVFSSRADMDQQLALGTDNIFAGRFVLVKYDINSNIYLQGDILYGFKDNSVPPKIYADKLCQEPYIFTTFTKVVNPSQEDCANYYYYTGRFYFKLPGPNYYRTEDEDYYYTPDCAENNIVSLNKIVQLKDLNGNLINSFYQCSGTVSGEDATWTEIITDQNYSDYFTNFQIDAAFYADSFDTRGYDGTVWQKVYSEGKGKFIPIARLNGSIPAFEFVVDPPTLTPTAPYIDSMSTDQLYRIHVPTHWGFQIQKTADSSKSDVKEGMSDLAIYLNLGANSTLGPTLYHINESHTDTLTNNTIAITKTGKSGTLYNGEELIDTQELSINLPVIGNMIDKGYDLIYGPGEPGSDPLNTNLIRHRDIAWYEADQDALKLDGDVNLGGKTYNLTSLAGIINTMHNQLGQIIKTLPTRPDASMIPQYSNNYIYHILDEDKYFRIGPSYHYTALTDTDYNFTPVSYNPLTYVTDTYYYLDNGQYTISRGIADPSNPPQLYQKNVSGEMYHEVTNLIPYYPSTYFVQQGVDYIRDNENQPSYAFYPDGTYYNITETTPILGSSFDGEYAANTYYYLDNGNYILDTSDVATADRQYYENFNGTRYSNAILYVKNKFYYLNPTTGAYSMCAYDTLSEAQAALGNNTQLYWLEFDETQEIVVSYEINGVIETFIGHPLKENGAHPLVDQLNNPVTLFGMRSILDITNIYCEMNNNYIAYANLNYNTQDAYGVPLYAKANDYIDLNIADISPVSNLYVTGKYYYVDGYGNYMRSYSHLARNTTYYLIDTAVPLTQPFYVANTYYYESSTDYFEIDISSAMTPGRSYYSAEKLYVIADYTGRCPYGYEWSNYSVFVPASVTLGRREDGRQFTEITNFMKDGASINSNLLQLEKLLETNNLDTRDKNTMQGAINQVQDVLYVLDRLVPRQMLFVNDFGQITSSTINYQALLDIISKHDQIMNL